jgi:hypothetical protein
MDLIGALGTFEKVLDLFAGSPAPHEPWAASEEAFGQHFGDSYEDFMALVGCLSPEQASLLEKTLEVNPEAAVLWVLAMEPVET